MATETKIALKHFEGAYLVETTNGYLIDNRGLIDKYEPKNAKKLQEATNHFNRVVKLIKQSRYAKGGTIEIGDSVHIPSFNKSGVVVKKHKHKPRFVYIVKFVDNSTAPYIREDLEKIEEMGNGGGLDGIANNNFENKLWDNLQTRSMGFAKGKRIKGNEFGEILKVKDIDKIKQGDILGFVYKEEGKTTYRDFGKVRLYDENDSWSGLHIDGFPFEFDRKLSDEEKNNPNFELKEIENSGTYWSLYHLKKNKNGTTIDDATSLFYNKENFDDETVLCVSKLYGCIIWRDSLGRLMKVDNISNPTKMYFIDNGQVIGRIRLSYLKNKCIIESFWLNGTSSDKLIYCDKMLKKIASHINTDLLVVYANNLNDNILKKILIDFGFKETASKELHFECNGSCGKGFAKGTTIEGKPRKKYIVWRAKDSYSSREIIAESDTSIGANQILSKREKKGEFEGYSNWGYDNTQDYFFQKGQYTNYEKGSKPSGGGIDLVHVYDENGEMYGTGELVEVKGNKTVVRFDAMDTREFDSDRVKPVMENGGKIKNWEYSIGGL